MITTDPQTAKALLKANIAAMAMWHRRTAALLADYEQTGNTSTLRAAVEDHKLYRSQRQKAMTRATDLGDSAIDQVLDAIEQLPAIPSPAKRYLEVVLP